MRTTLIAAALVVATIGPPTFTDTSGHSPSHGFGGGHLHTHAEAQRIDLGQWRRVPSDARSAFGPLYLAVSTTY